MFSVRIGCCISTRAFTSWFAIGRFEIIAGLNIAVKTGILKSLNNALFFVVIDQRII